jgi:acetyl-CoA acetyltransferase
MIYDAPCSLPGASFAHLPIYGLEDLGFVPRGEAGAFIAGHNTAPGGKLPLNTNGGGLCYMHSGMYALQESVRQLRGHRPRPNPRRHDLGLPRRRRHVRRLRHDHHVERSAMRSGF